MTKLVGVTQRVHLMRRDEMEMNIKRRTPTNRERAPDDQRPTVFEALARSPPEARRWLFFEYAKPASKHCLMGWLTALAMALSGAARAENLPVVPKWGRFEQSFQSTVLYSNAPQQVGSTVLFTSPLGETKRVDAFWDGGKTWRVRFSPNQSGRWSYLTLCSDPANGGLGRRKGSFLCTAATGQNRFTRHGPVQIARDRRHFTHEDGTPFFWLADSAWEGARVSEPKDWETYARVRAAQKFSAVQWALTSSKAETSPSAFTGRERIILNPDFFQRLDVKVDTLNRAGLLSVIAPFWNGGDRRVANKLPEDQFVVLLRYMVARWSAYDVAWLLIVDAANATDVERCQKAGRAVFGDVAHAPVTLMPAKAAFEQFRAENWVDVFGYASNLREESWRQIVSGLIRTEWRQEPARPLINLEPADENKLLENQTRVTGDEVRCAVWSSLLLAPPAGVGYAAEGVAKWSTTIEHGTGADPGTELPAWQRSLFLPGAKQMAAVSQVFNSIEFWRLRPATTTKAAQVDVESRRKPAASAATEDKGLALVYVPDADTLQLALDFLPLSPIVGWTNPRTGESSPAVAVVEGRTCQFPAPAPGDWLLMIRAGK